MKLLFIQSLRKFILTFFTALLVATAVFTIQMTQPETAAAQSCRYVGQCVGNKKCVCPTGVPFTVCRYYPASIQIGDADCGSAIIGGVEPPTAVSAINSESGSEIGIIFFISRLITVANIVAGILVMINFVLAGFIYITNAGNTAANTQVTEKLTWSVIGILVIVSSYTLAAIFGVIFYGDPTYVLSPTLETPTTIIK